MEDADGGPVAALGDLAALRAALDSGALTARELTAACLARVEELDPLLHSVISLSAAAAADAAELDVARAAGAAPGPLAGIPVLIKDNIAVRRMPATAGSPALAGAEQDEAFLVGRLRDAGAVILGKANLSEWANFRGRPSSSGWSALGGQAANPYALDRSPSGSSSGSAVAVAAGLVPLAVGTETDGSIVCPASVCGVVGIKPTLGLVSRSGVVPVSLQQDTAGPMARTVAGAAAMLSVLAGPDRCDPVTSAAAGQRRDYTAFLDPGALAGARLGVWRDPLAGAHVTRDVLAGALAVLREAGAELVDPVELPGADQVSDPEFAALVCEFKHDLNVYLAGLGGSHPATLSGLIDFNLRNDTTELAFFGQELFERAEATSGDLTDPDYLASRARARQLAREALDGPLRAHRLDAVVSLTMGPAGLTDHLLGDHSLFITSAPSAVAGYPAITVPAATVGGLPVGLSFMGRAWNEPRLIALAHAFELASPRLSPPSLAPAVAVDSAVSLPAGQR